MRPTPMKPSIAIGCPPSGCPLPSYHSGGNMTARTRPFPSTAVGACPSISTIDLEDRPMTVSRRKFLPAAATVATAALAAPAIAQGDPTLKWRLTSSFPKSLDTLFGAAQTIARVTSEMTDGKFQLTLFGAGEIVPGLQVLDAVANNTV